MFPSITQDSVTESPPELIGPKEEEILPLPPRFQFVDDRVAAKGRGGTQANSHVCCRFSPYRSMDQDSWN